MLDLDKVKLVLFDFDDTLCIRSRRKSIDNKGIDFIARILGHGSERYDYSFSPSFIMKWFVIECASQGKSLGVLSAVAVAQEAELKMKYVIENYDVNMINYCCSSVEDKIQVLEAIAISTGIPKECILLVDDLTHTIEKAADAGFMTCSPMEIVVLYEKEFLISKKKGVDIS